MFSYKIIIILLCNSPWAEGKEANFLHTGAHQNPGVKIIKAVIDISYHLGSDIIPEVCALDWKKYCFYKYLKNGLSNILNQKKIVFSWHVYSYPSSINNGNETNLALFKSRFSSENSLQVRINRFIQLDLDHFSLGKGTRLSMNSQNMVKMRLWHFKLISKGVQKQTYIHT